MVIAVITEVIVLSALAGVVSWPDIDTDISIGWVESADDEDDDEDDGYRLEMDCSCEVLV